MPHPMLFPLSLCLRKCSWWEALSEIEEYNIKIESYIGVGNTEITSSTGENEKQIIVAVKKI